MYAKASQELLIVDRAGAKKNKGMRLPQVGLFKATKPFAHWFYQHEDKRERGSDQDEDKGNEEAEANFNYCLVGCHRHKTNNVGPTRIKRPYLSNLTRPRGQGCNSIDILNFGPKTGGKSGPRSGQNSVHTPSLNMSQNSKHD